MKRITRMFIIFTFVICGLKYVNTSHLTAYGSEMLEDNFIDFSSEKSTLFFRLNGGDNKTIFFDFYSPFDPTVKVESYDPLIQYELNTPYYFNENNILMIEIEELRRLYAPYFDYEISDDTLAITHAQYDREIIDGYGERSTTFEYTKKVWDLQLNLTGNLNSGNYQYQEYEPVIGGRNKELEDFSTLNNKASFSNVDFVLESGEIEVKDESCYVPLVAMMTLMGKEAIEEEGYLAISQANLADVTLNILRDDTLKIAETKIPRASNIWNAGAIEEVSESYTWANYMNDVADGVRTSGWLWKSFYMPSGSHFKDENGKLITLNADRIVPFNMYVPSTYDKDTTRLVVMLHGGTGNENTATHRIATRDVYIEEYAESYNYIILSPNGWTQNPIWREEHALYSFEESYNTVMSSYPVDDNNVFISGNSLGGRGTLELAMRYPDRFSAMFISAPKIFDRDRTTRENYLTFLDTDYKVDTIENMKAMIVQGTADTTTSFKVQIGNEQEDGMIVKGLMPVLKNASYVTVEKGNHSYAYSSTMKMMFDFFEQSLKEIPEPNFKTPLNLIENSKKAILGEDKIRLINKIQVVDDVSMITLSDLQNIFGEAFEVHHINSYDSSSMFDTDYITILLNGQSLNLTVDQNRYRLNMERYKEDAREVKSGAVSDEDLLKSAPTFTVAPYEKNGEVYVPVKEVLTALGGEIEVSQQQTPFGFVVISSGVSLVLASTLIKRKKTIEK